jgi:hypothetical protein
MNLLRRILIETGLVVSLLAASNGAATFVSAPIFLLGPKVIYSQDKEIINRDKIKENIKIAAAVHVGAALSLFGLLYSNKRIRRGTYEEFGGRNS